MSSIIHTEPPSQLVLDEGLDFLVVAPHPDDAELGMGGTIAKMVSQGWRIGILDLTTGEPTPHGSESLRREETLKATDTLQESLNALPAVFMHDAYSREFELEADDYAFQMLSEAGLSPDSLGDALRRLSEEHGGDEGLKYFSSHPPFEDRIRRAAEASR